jgi:ABC-type Fe3+-hydroxamate transport system substrate-binding protein
MMATFVALAALALPAIISTGAAATANDKTVTSAAPRRRRRPRIGPRRTPTITDMLGRKVTIPAAPKVIAALSPTTVEYTFAVGAKSVTRSTSVKYPEEAKAAVDLGASYQPNLELLAAQKPDLIIADSVLQPQLVENPRRWARWCCMRRAELRRRVEGLNSSARR